MSYHCHLSDVLPQRPRPKAPDLALLFYDDVLLKHPVLDTPEGYELGAGRLLGTEDIGTLITRLAQQQSLVMTRANTLACGVGKVVWWLPPSTRPLVFDAKYEQTKSIARLSHQPVPLPGLVLCAAERSLQVFAVRGRERPEAHTPLCHAPFWNIFSHGAVCQGSVTYPKEATPQQQEKWEEAFFNSTFTGPSRTDRYMNWGKSYEELLDKAIREGAFPEHVLIDSGKTLENVVLGGGK